MEQEALNKLRQLKALLQMRARYDDDNVPDGLAEQMLILCDYFDFYEIGLEPGVIIGYRKYLVSSKLPNRVIVCTGDNLNSYKREEDI